MLKIYAQNICSKYMLKIYAQNVFSKFMLKIYTKIYLKEENILDQKA